MIGIIGDMHLKPNLSYSEYIDDERIAEEKSVFDCIYNNLKDCERIVFLGDLLNGKNNKSEVLKKMVKFIERFDKQEIYIIAGNHEKNGDGTSSLDFLKEVKNPRWHVITDKIKKIDNMVFCPNFSKAELGVTDNESGRNKIMEELPGADIVFVHHAISSCSLNGGGTTDLFDEVVLDSKEIERKYKYIFGGHIHKPQKYRNVFIAGSIFNNEVGESKKSVLKLKCIDKNTFELNDIELPGRGIYKFENPIGEELDNVPKDSIVKVILTDKKLKPQIEKLRKKLSYFDAHVLLEQFPKERKKLHFEEGMLEFNVEELLEVYAKQKKINVGRLKEAFNIIK